MSKRVAIQKGLEEIKAQLNKFGYEVFDIDEKQNVEAVIYIADGYNIPDYSQFINVSRENNEDFNCGPILINAKGKIIEEIQCIIENRLYSKMFE